ncbi:UNVERIFIED_ORG: hypothetical protein ABIC97_005241 [Peribacillus simplex]
MSGTRGTVEEPVMIVKEVLLLKIPPQPMLFIVA